MPPPRFALVSYVTDSVAQFVQQLRRDLNPGPPHFAAHLTLLPPRYLQGSESSALETLEEICGRVEPFEVSLGEIETFIPITPTVFVRVDHAAYKMRELHDRLNTKSLLCVEQWPYMPHLTIEKLQNEDQAQQAYLLARRLWAEFKGSRSIHVNELTFVREEAPNQWVDLAAVRLGSRLVRR